MAHSLYKVIGVEILDEYTLRVAFDDGAIQVINFEPVLYGAMWGPLREPAFFRRVAIDPIAHTLSWPNGADFDPETLRHWPDCADELAARSQKWSHVPA
ncbi:MAG: DUF2442 domain-containing protein [Caldilineaceae bacterium]|nr:DUF2442 domain-containing protein [Caldilineaceae bacterium]